jgi:hypothetical protein
MIWIICSAKGVIVEYTIEEFNSWLDEHHYHISVDEQYCRRQDGDINLAVGKITGQDERFIGIAIYHYLNADPQVDNMLVSVYPFYYDKVFDYLN